MSKEKALEKRLDELKFYRGVVVGVIIGVLSWIFTSYKTISNLLIGCGIAMVVIAFIVLIAVTFAISNKIDEIEKE